MSKKVLFVDDEPNVLRLLRRVLRGHFDIETAEGGEEALEKMRAGGNYAVVVSDMRMPAMNGVELLEKTRELYPDTVRMMLTGNADQQTAVDAVNHGEIFLFLNKPCEPEHLKQAVARGIRQHELITAERDVLENTLRASIKSMISVLSLTNPTVFGHSMRIRAQVRQLARSMKLDAVWMQESAALLSQLGCVSLDRDLVQRKVSGHRLQDDEIEEYAGHASVGATLVQGIPRLEEVASAIRYQEKCYDGSGYPRDDVKGDALPLGARLLKFALDVDALEMSGLSREEVRSRIEVTRHRYDPRVVAAFDEGKASDVRRIPAIVKLTRLTNDMILADDVRTNQDVLLVAKGQDTNLSVRRHLLNFYARKMIADSVAVLQKEE